MLWSGHSRRNGRLVNETKGSWIRLDSRKRLVGPARRGLMLPPPVEVATTPAEKPNQLLAMRKKDRLD